MKLLPNTIKFRSPSIGSQTARHPILLNPSDHPLSRISSSPHCPHLCMVSSAYTPSLTQSSLSTPFSPHLCMVSSTFTPVPHPVLPSLSSPLYGVLGVHPVPHPVLPQSSPLRGVLDIHPRSSPSPPLTVLTAAWCPRRTPPFLTQSSPHCPHLCMVSSSYTPVPHPVLP